MRKHLLTACLYAAFLCGHAGIAKAYTEVELPPEGDQRDCYEDVDFDGVVDDWDYKAVSQIYAQQAPQDLRADTNGNGEIDSVDFQRANSAYHFGEICTPVY